MMAYDPLDAPNVTYLWTQLLIEELVRNGVDTFFVAPGSRSTPLTVSAVRHPEARVVLHVDERGTAFATLGYGRATQRPAAWITTSGTAVANGQPAVVEASVDGVPMLLLTADRPPELRDTGANQTIDQVKIFGDYVRWQVDVPPPSVEVDPAYVLTTTNQAVHQSRRVPAGPVHLNCGFRKPLEPVESDRSIEVPDPVADWAREETPFTTYPTPVPSASAPDVDAVASAVEGGLDGLVVAGRLDREADVKATRRLAARLGWPLLPDITSRLRLGPESRADRCAFGDLILTSDDFQKTQRPEAVVQVGGRFTSKRLRLFLRDANPDVWAVVRPDPSRIDPDHRGTHHVEADVASFVEQLLARVGAVPEPSHWQMAWERANTRAAAVVEEHAQSEALTEPSVATLLSRQVPSDHALMAASSMPVRDLNRHASTAGSAVPVYANRGASGIDGTVATAAGLAEAQKGGVTLLIGDLALWHDLNSLALLQDRPVVVVVLNNNGGGIFHFLPIQEYDDVFDPHFTTPQHRDFEAVAETFTLAYHRPDSRSAFIEAYRHACDAGEPTILEVKTERESNRQIHEQIEKAVADVVGGGTGVDDAC
ncbi:2-succinyl-5-enolpyruvyl-6-hydroxy-3-cyclohexene-1-carboxylic-acid synthase [Salinibacter sp. 10B]|uniref:2-succinyl-5-enolpyruvyl-6-hydroxy-3- cyclohexene-1-carboxylic-acid synthase n=1 Tax=Salinibacter sp. 10B TaxID=1923971 RepID=UPI000CF3ED05